MKNDELAALADEQLVHKELELERTLMGHTFRHRLGQLENNSILKSTRRDIARTQTMLTAREHDGGLAKGSLRARYRSSFVATQVVAEGGAGEDFLKGILDTQEPTE